jgi:hypothetical protein
MLGKLEGLASDPKNQAMLSKVAGGLMKKFH